MNLRTPHLLLSLLSLSPLLLLCTGHGIMCTPRQRGAYRSERRCGSSLSIPPNPEIDYCPHCLNAGGIGTIMQNLPPTGWMQFDPVNAFAATANRGGLCGDPKGNDDHMIGGRFMPYAEIPVVETWMEGSQIDMMAEIDTNHNGYFEYFVCDLDACGSNDIQGKCYRDGHCVRLNRVPHADCENPTQSTHTECGPIDASYPSRWYVPCRKTDNEGVHLVGGASGTMRFQLPDNFKCDRCVVQWYWATANSCAPPGFLNYFEVYNNPFGTTCPSDGGGVGAHRKGTAECGDDRLPEEFWSCADVRILADEGGPGTMPPTVTFPGTTTTTATTASTTTSTTTTLPPVTTTTTTTTPSTTATTTTPATTTTTPPTTSTTATLPPVTTTTTTTTPSTTATTTTPTTTTTTPTTTSPSTTTTTTTSPPTTSTIATTATTRISTSCPNLVCSTYSNAIAACRFRYPCEVSECKNSNGESSRYKKYICQPRPSPTPVSVPSLSPCPNVCGKKRKIEKVCKRLKHCKQVACIRTGRRGSRPGSTCRER